MKFQTLRTLNSLKSVAEDIHKRADKLGLMHLHHQEWMMHHHGDLQDT